MPIIIDEVQADVVPEREPAAAAPSAESGARQEPADPLDRLQRLQERLKLRQARLAAD